MGSCPDAWLDDGEEPGLDGAPGGSYETSVGLHGVSAGRHGVSAGLYGVSAGRHGVSAVLTDVSAVLTDVPAVPTGVCVDQCGVCGAPREVFAGQDDGGGGSGLGSSYEGVAACQAGGHPQWGTGRTYYEGPSPSCVPLSDNNDHDQPAWGCPPDEDVHDEGESLHPAFSAAAAYVLPVTPLVHSPGQNPNMLQS